MTISTAADGTRRVWRDQTDTDGLAPYAPDALSPGHTVLSVAAAGIGGAVATFVAWLILRATNLPAFGTSYVSRATSTALSVILLVTLLTFIYLWLQDEHELRHGSTHRRGRLRGILTHVLCYLSPAGLVITVLGVPLSATALYIDGVSVDQGFRTQYLTRLTDTAHLVDMNYADMPPFYPAGWFWLGGRFANLVGLAGWEAFQPWSLITLGAAGCILVPVWQRITGSLPVATGIALVTTTITLVVSAYEPYAAVIAMGAPAAAILARRALDGSKLSMLALIIYLGCSASMYTLFTAVIALSVVLLSVVMSIIGSRSIRPLLRLVVIGLGSLAIASIVWWPYLAAVLSGKPTSSSSATHYLPATGTVIPLPMFSFSIVGALCLLGLVYVVLRAADRDLRALGLTLVVYYGWAVASMIASLSGGTLLGFRLEILIALQLATAGVLAIAEIRLIGIDHLYPQQIPAKMKSSITALMVILLGFGGAYYVQDIPNKLSRGIDLAYTDTDGAGKRGDTSPPNAARHYAAINEFITSELGRPTGEIEILTDEFNLLSYYPFYGYQGLTAHYSNPLGLFEQRNEQLSQWAHTSFDSDITPAEFAEYMKESSFGMPDAFVFRGQLDEDAEGADKGTSGNTDSSAALTDVEDSGASQASASGGAAGTSSDASKPTTGTAWKHDIAEDIFPNDPNVLLKALWFNPDKFTAPGAPWTVKQIGPFVVAVFNG